MVASTSLNDKIRDLPCDAKLAFVVLEQRGPFTLEELTVETYLSKDETVWALAVLEKENLVNEYQNPEQENKIYETIKQ